MYKNLLLGSAAISLMLGAGFAYGASPSTTSTTPPSVPMPNEAPSQNTMSPVTPSARPESANTGKYITGQRTGMITPEMTSTASGFVQAAAQSDLYQIASGNIAMKRAQSPDVRNYARQMVTAHIQMNNQIKSLASAGHVLAIPTQVDNRRQAMLDNLKSGSSVSFDTRYIRQQMEAQNEARTLYHGYAKSGDDQTLKAFASDTAPKIDQHLATLRRLERANIANADSDQPAPAPSPQPY